MSWLDGVNEQLLNEVKADTVATGSGVLESGVYLTKITQAFLRKTDSGALMFELQGIGSNEENIFWSTCAKSGDAKGNKSTYTDKNGKEQLLPGMISIKHLFEACGVSMSSDPVVAKVQFKNDVIDAKVFKELTGKKFKACVRQYENEYNGEINIRYDIENFLNVDGLNKDGEDMETVFKKKIEGSPIKLLKKKQQTAPQVSEAETASSGW